MPDHIQDAIIVGAGPTGASLALGLAQLGYAVTVIDARDPAEALRADGRNFAVVTGSWRMLKRLGVAAQLDGKTEALRGLEAVDGGRHWFGAPSVLFTPEDIASPDPDEMLGQMVRAEDLQAALDHKLSTTPNVSVRAPARFVELTRSPECCTLTLQDGSALSARLVIGADGASSPVRQALQIGIEGRDYGQSVFTANVKLSRPHGGIARQLFTPEGPFATLPLPDNHANLAWYMKRGAAETLARLPITESAAELNARFADFAGEMEIVSVPGAYPLKLQIAQKLIADRAALIGDAARRVTPLAGQGLNQGFRDVAALIESAVATRRLGGALGSPQMLQAYSQARHFEGSAVALFLDGIDRLFSNDSLLTKPVRALGLFAAASLSPLRQAMTQRASASEPNVPSMMDVE